MDIPWSVQSQGREEKITFLVLTDLLLNQGLSKHQEVGFTPVTKLTNLVVVFLDLLVVIKI